MALPGGGLRRLGRWGAAQAGDSPPLAEIFTALQTPLLVIDPAGNVAEANVAAETLLNLGRSAIIGRAIEAMVGDALANVPADAPFAAYDQSITLPGGRSHRADLTAAPLPERAGWRVIAIHAQAPAHLAGRRRGEHRGSAAAVGAAAMLAHEIKNPLSAIRGAAQLLESSAEEGARDLTRLIREEVDRVAALIDRMEGFTDTRPLELGPQNIHAILSHAREVALQGFARGCSIREVYDPSLPAVRGHRDTLIQILINLLKNAAEAMGGTGSITLTTAYRHGLSVLNRKGNAREALPIEVCVIDEGPGVPADIEPYLFEPFVTSKRSGSGLGLALVDKLVSDQGGMIEYSRETREGGPARTVFRVLLPRARDGVPG